MAKQRLSDGEAKNILGRWPNKTRGMWQTPDNSSFWLRAQPSQGGVPGPKLSSPGARLFRTQPDALWLLLQKEFCDAIAVEVCGTVQNLNDKRSRYIPANHSVVSRCSSAWLSEKISIQKGGMRPRWKLTSHFNVAPGELQLPIRHLRVLFVLPNEIYDQWIEEHVPAGYEFYCPHSSLDSYTSQKMQRFLRQMSMTSHYYTR